MDTKAKFKDDVILDMSRVLAAGEITMLEQILIKHLHEVTMDKAETLPATSTDVNSYFIEMFVQLKSQKLSDKTIDAYTNAVKNLIRVVDKPLNTINTMDIEYYLYSIKDKNSVVSLDNQRRFLSSFFNFMKKKQIIQYNPCDGVEAYRKPDKPIEYLTVEQMDQLRAKCQSKKERAYVEFLRCTALRVGEVIEVRINEIDWRSGKLTVYGHKTRKYRTVMIDEICRVHLIEYIKSRGLDLSSDEYLFAGDRNKGKMQTSQIRRDLKDLGSRATITHLHPHLFRKTTATNIVIRGGSITDAGDYLGHVDRSVVGKHYVHRSEDHIQKIFDNYVKAV